MKSILLIGLGRYGRHVARKLHAMHHEIMAVDRNEELVNEVLPYTNSALIADSTDGHFLESLGVRNFDACIVAIGDDFQSSLETTLRLRELGAEFVHDDLWHPYVTRDHALITGQNPQSAPLIARHLVDALRFAG